MKQVLLLLIAMLVLGCEESLFKPSPTDVDELFEVVHDYDGRRIIYPTAITLTWSNLSIDRFTKFVIKQKFIVNNSIQWKVIRTLTDSLATSITALLEDDDLSSQYKIYIYNEDGKYKTALSEPFYVPKVTSVLIPEDYVKPKDAHRSRFIDNGDTVIVNPGTYEDFFTFLFKDVLIKSSGGPDVTFLTIPYISTARPVIVKINDGIIDGFSITGGRGINGGAIYAFGDAVVKNCVITGNTAIGYIQERSTGKGAGIFASDHAIIVECIIENNYANFVGGGIYIAKQYTDVVDVQIINTTIKNNSAMSGGGIYVDDNCLPIIRNSIIEQNYVSQQGGGIGISGKPLLFNCLIKNNVATYGGGGVSVEFLAKPKLVNCVIYENQSINSAVNGAISKEKKSSITLINSIVWGNSGYGQDSNFLLRSSTYSDIQGYGDTHGVGNIDINPLFADPEFGDFHLLQNSPCLDAGNPSVNYNDVNGTRNDMGVYGGEYGDW